jgi:hypothetical protein
MCHLNTSNNIVRSQHDIFFYLTLEDKSLRMKKKRKSNWQHLQKYDVNVYSRFLSLPLLFLKDLIIVCSLKYQSDKNEEVIIVNLCAYVYIYIYDLLLTFHQ